MRPIPAALRLAALRLAALCLAAAAASARAEPPALVAYTVLDAAAIPAPLTPQAGDPVRGAALAAAQCLDCHGRPDGAAPPLAEAAAGLEAGALRLAVVNLAIARPEVAGHAFHDAGPAETVAPPLLSAQDVEDVVAWLAAGAR